MCAYTLHFHIERRTEVLNCLGGDVLVQLHDDAPSRASTDGDVKEDIGPVGRHFLHPGRCMRSSQGREVHRAGERWERKSHIRF